MIPQALLLLLSLIPVLHAQSDNPGLLCTDHPAYTASLTPVLVSSWSLFLSLPDSEQVVYIPRYTGHRYAPTADTLSLKYAGLDFFHTASKPRTPNFRMHFQRAAMVYMFVDVPDANYDPAKTASLIGWTSEGWVSRVEGASTITYGIHQQLTKSMTTYAYVFSKVTSSGLYADMPQTRFVKKKISGISVPGTFNLWLAEADGSASPPVGTFAGAVVQPNTVCPAALHNTWVAFDGNTADTDTDGVAFGTWHPQWDPCFWW